jgi:hypothetical protein
MRNQQWIRDIAGALSVSALAQYVTLWSRLQDLHLQSEVDDTFIWKWAANHQYSASSAYRAFFHGQCGIHGARKLAKVKAPPSCKFFVWTALLGRCWWLSSCKQLPRQRRKRFDSMVILVWWSLWKERNDRVFNNGSRQAAALLIGIRSGALSWVTAGFLDSAV